MRSFNVLCLSGSVGASGCSYTLFKSFLDRGGLLLFFVFHKLPSLRFDSTVARYTLKGLLNRSKESPFDMLISLKRHKSASTGCETRSWQGRNLPVEVKWAPHLLPQ